MGEFGVHPSKRVFRMVRGEVAVGSLLLHLFFRKQAVVELAHAIWEVLIFAKGLGVLSTGGLMRGLRSVQFIAGSSRI